MARKQAKQKFRLATLDIETDPFLHGRTPMPFCIGFYDGENYQDFWGDDCIFQMMEYLAEYPEPCKIYVHNGGGFDFWFMQNFITNPIFFINKRVAKCGLLDRHEMRDSYKMIPIPLGKFMKEEIDYRKLEEKVREKHKKEILRFLYFDCKYLYDMVQRFTEEYGEFLTIGAASLHHMREMHPGNDHESKFFDARFRPWYMGGRNQCFETGAILRPLKYYDVNSLYPDRMANAYHPLGNQYRVLSTIPEDREDEFYFARIKANSQGALPIYTKTGLKFPHGVNDFYATSHEIKMARSLGLLKIIKVEECLAWKQVQRYDTYINHHIAKKIAAEEAGDKGGREFSKLFANNGYGKQGQDPSKYRDCKIFEDMETLINEGYNMAGSFGERFIGQKPTEIKPWSYNNVAIAASITSASRAKLMHGLAHSERPVYCDTDSIICDSADLEIHPTKLGAWKLEAELAQIHIAGKKLYAGYDDNGVCIKKASKGVNLDGDTIRAIAAGEVVEVARDAPSLRFAQPAQFISRKIRSTA